MDKLKKCPFCGGEAEFHRTPVKSNGGWCDSVVVRCKVCEARTNRVLYNAKKHPNGEEYDEAQKTWNTRKPVEEILKRLERLGKYEGYDDCPKDGMCNGEHCNTCYTDTAIQIIKEEFNIDELQNSSETQHSGTKCRTMEHIQQRFERVM